MTGRRRIRAAGFTLVESIVVIGVLAIVAACVLSIMPQVFTAQNELRDEATGVALMQSCAERLLGVRRQVGYNSVTTALCSGITASGSGFNAPTVVLRDAAGAVIAGSPAQCSGASATCTATISIARSSGPNVALAPLTLQLRLY